MSNTITIDGESIDINEPCAVLTALRKAELRVAVGESVSMTRFGEDEVRFSSANAGRLEKLIAHYERLCDRASGKRRRHAMNVRWS